MEECAVVVTLTVKAAFPLLAKVTLEGLTVHVAFGGAFPQLKFTVPAKLLFDETPSWYVAVCPALAVCVVVEVLEKLKGPIPIPLRLMTCGLAAALSAMLTVPV